MFCMFITRVTPYASVRINVEELAYISVEVNLVVK